MTLTIESGLDRDPFRCPKGAGAYEWWYFDAVDATRDLALVVIFFRGMPFSGVRQRSASRSLRAGTPDDAGDFPAIAFSLYERGRTIAYMANLHPPDVFQTTARPLECSIGGNHARWDGTSWHLTLNDVLLDLSPLRATLSFTPFTLPRPSPPAPTASHTWIIAAPHCRVSAQIELGDRKLTFEGTGYHDHNSGDAPLQSMFQRWEWGRASDADDAYIYYRTIPHAGLAETHLVHVKDGGVSVATAEWQVSGDARNLYGLRWHRSIEVGSDMTLRHFDREIVDNGPFYARFVGSFITPDGRRMRGFSEVLEPRALDWRWFWPLLDSRVRPVNSRDVLGRRITNWLVRQGY